MVISSKQRKPKWNSSLFHVGMPTLQDSCMYLVMYCSLAQSGRLICIVRSWEFCFAMLTSVRAKWCTGSSGKTSLDLAKCFSRISCWAYGRWLCCLIHEVAVGKLPLIVTSCIIVSCVKPHYYHSAFLCSGFHSCPSNWILDDSSKWDRISQQSSDVMYNRTL